MLKNSRDWSDLEQSESVRKKKFQKISLLGKNSGETMFPFNREIQCILFQTPQIALESLQSLLLL